MYSNPSSEIGASLRGHLASSQVDATDGASGKPRFTLSEHDMLPVIVLSTCCTSTHFCPLTTMSPSPGKSPIDAPVSETRWRRLRQLALRRLLSAPDRASGCPKLWPASANQPFGLRWPAIRPCFQRGHAPMLPALTLCTYIPWASVCSFRPASPATPPRSSRFLTNVKVMNSSFSVPRPAALTTDLRECLYRLCLCRDRLPQHSGILNIAH